VEADQLRPGKLVRRHIALRGFDLFSGVAKLRWNLPGENSVCSDLSIDAGDCLYFTDTINARIYKFSVHAKTPELFLEDPAHLIGVDGITFLEGELYVTNVFTNKLYRIPVNVAGKAEEPIKLTTDRPIKGPDGMRSSRDRLFVAESGDGKIDLVTIHADKAAITLIKEGINTPTAVEPTGDVVWITERGTGKVMAIPLEVIGTLQG
jgi:sugar lactone lactonase YvrE